MANVAVRSSGGLGVFSIGLYLLIMAFILFNYVRAVFQLYPFRDRITGAYGILVAPTFSFDAVVVIGVVVLLILLFYRRILGLMNYIPAGIRGLVLPIPFYFISTRNIPVTAVLVVLGVVLWVLYRPVGTAVAGALKSVPPPVLEPLARFWAGILYTALVTRAPIPVITALVVLLGYHYLDKVVEWVFAPVWDWHRALPTATWFGLFAGRLVVGGTAPLLLSMYFAWFNWGYDTATPIFGALAGLVGYFLLRMPRGGAPAQQSGKEVTMAAFLSALGRVWWKALLLGTLLALWKVGFAFADDCSGPGDCAGTTWVQNAFNNGVLGTILGGLGLVPVINLLFPGLKIPGTPGHPVLPPRPAGPMTTQDVVNKVNNLVKAANTHKNAELANVIDKYKNNLFGPDGKVRPDQWANFQKEAKDAIGHWAQSGDKPNSWVWDAGASVVGAGGTFIWEVGSKIGDAAIWVGTKELQIGDAILHPVDTYEGMKQTGKDILTGTMQWIDQHGGREIAHEFNDAMKKGDYVDALKAFGKLEGTILWEGGKAIGHEMLPIDELSSLFDPNASLEEKLWAIPAAAAKIASLLTFSEAAATMPVPGIDKATTLIPSVEKAASQLAQMEKLAALAKTEGVFGEAAKATQQVEGLMTKALSESGPITNYKQLQSIIAKNPELAQAVDDAIRAGGDGSSLYKMAASGTMSNEANALITARKLGLQEEAVANATKRILQEESQAIIEAGGKPPGSFQTFNASQGSRTQLWGANAKTDLDQTILGIQNVSKERAAQILEEEMGKLKMNPQNLDSNLYLPGKGKLADAAGSSAFSEDAVKRLLNQGTSESGRYHVFVDKAGEVHVTGPFKGQGADVLGPESVYHTPGTRIPPGTPAEMLTPAQQADLAQQLHKVDGYAQAGEWDKVVKSANRASDLGAYDQSTRDLIRKLAGEKRPAQLTELLHNSGYSSWDQFVNHLNGF